MAHVTYDAVEHDGGFAYKVGDVFSKTFPTHQTATKLLFPRPSANSCRGKVKPSSIKTIRASGTKSGPTAATGRRLTSRTLSKNKLSSTTWQVGVVRDRGGDRNALQCISYKLRDTP